MTSTQYIYAWLIYLIGVAGCLFIWWHITAKIKLVAVRRSLRFSALFALITPVYLSSFHNFMAPALMSAVFDLMTYGLESLISGSAGGLVILSTIAGVGLAFLTCSKLPGQTKTENNSQTFSSATRWKNSSTPEKKQDTRRY